MTEDLHDELDPVWRALASPIRRRILDVLAEGPETTGALADRFGALSRFAIMQHLKVLEEATLVIARRDGRRRFNHFNAVPIQRIHRRWVSRYAGRWADSLVALKDELEADDVDASGSAPGCVA